jgi:hypothetical protein
MFHLLHILNILVYIGLLMFSGDISLIIGLTTISTKFAVLTIVSSKYSLVNLHLFKKLDIAILQTET